MRPFGKDRRAGYLIEYLDATLSAPERATLERQLQERPELRQRLEMLKRDFADLAALPAALEETPAREAQFRAAVWRRLHAQEEHSAADSRRRPRGWFWAAVPLAAAASVALLALLGPIGRFGQSPPAELVRAPLPPSELGLESNWTRFTKDQLEQASTALYAAVLPESAQPYVEALAPSAEEMLLELDPSDLDLALSELERAGATESRSSGSAT
jgi:hypothetical protein